MFNLNIFFQLVIGTAVILGYLPETLHESSGLAASLRDPGYFWTHNDSGDGAFIYTINSQGEIKNRWELDKDMKGQAIRNVDWEDIAVGPGPTGDRALYIGDIGDNSMSRKEKTIYRISEPPINKIGPLSIIQRKIVERAEKTVFKYPDEIRHNAETLLVVPRSGEVYIITKSSLTHVFQIVAPFTNQTVVREINDGLKNTNVGFNYITGGSVSHDGKKLILRNTGNIAYEYSLPPNSRFEEIFKQTPRPINIRVEDDNFKQGEAICYSYDDKSLFTTSDNQKPQSPIKLPFVEVKFN